MKNAAIGSTYFFMFILTACNFCYAETPLLQPNDVDLKAAYCLTIQRDNVNSLTTIMTYAESLKTDGTNQKFKDLSRRNLSEAEDRFNHIQTYLVPRLEYIDANALTGAIERAKQDILFISNESTINCSRQCSSGIHENITACVNKCAPEQFSKLRSCEELSWLPF
jgi:hypothetical protein